MSAVFEDITAAIGYTPLVKINRLGSPRKGQNRKIHDRSSRKRCLDKA